MLQFLMLLTMALPTCVAVSSGSEQPRQSGGTAGTGSPPSSATWLPQCPGQRLSTIPGSRRAVRKQGAWHRAPPPKAFPAGFVPQALSKAGGNREAGGWVLPETEGKGVAAAARE